MLIDYVRRHHVALLALVVALGGTSYAAVQLPENSVGTQQLRPKAVTPAKLSTKVRAQLATAGTPGAAGAKGEKGDKGDQGDQGVPGVQGPPGPTSAGIGGTNVAITPVAGSPLQGAASVTLTQPGKVLVLLTGTFSVRCTTAGACRRDLSVQVAGQTVPGSLGSVSSASGALTSQPLDIAGILSGVPAGTHEVRIASRMGVGAAESEGNAGDVRLVAIALG